MKWKTQDGKVIDIKDMGYTHLENSINYLERRLKLETPNEKLSQRKFDGEFSRNLKSYFSIIKAINALRKEFKKRNMYIIKEHPDPDSVYETERDLKDELKHFGCFIKCPGLSQDFEVELDAISKEEAIKKLLKMPQLIEYDENMLEEHVSELKTINYDNTN